MDEVLMIECIKCLIHFVVKGLRSTIKEGKECMGILLNSLKIQPASAIVVLGERKRERMW